MSAHLVKCLYCGEQFDVTKEAWVKPRSNRYAHARCAEHQTSLLSKEEQEKEELEEYIKQLFDISSITPKIRRQIQQYKEKENIPYVEMLNTLRYWYEVRKNNLSKANGGIGIIGYVHRDAVLYFQSIANVVQQNEEIDLQSILLPEREVYIKPPERQPMRNFKRLFSFLEEEDNGV